MKRKNLKLKAKNRSAKKRPQQGSKSPKAASKFKPKQYNIAAIASNVRKTACGFGCTKCERRMAGVVNTGRRGFSKRIFRKESLYISR